jgi:hypothetical protein
MKQELVNSYSGSNLDEFADLDGWEGYEFWSIQVEAQMEPLGGPERPKAAERRERTLRGFPVEKERHGDVLPF